MFGVPLPLLFDLRGVAIFPHPWGWSIFAAAGLSFQVRNGGWAFPQCYAPRKTIRSTPLCLWVLVVSGFV